VRAHAATCSSQTLRKSWRLRFDRSTRKNSMLASDSNSNRTSPSIGLCTISISLSSYRIVNQSDSWTANPRKPRHAAATRDARLCAPAFLLTLETGGTSWHAQGSVYTPFSDQKIRPCYALRVWYRSCSEHGALLRKTTPRQVLFMCLSGDKSEECHAAKTSNSVCR